MAKLNNEPSRVNTRRTKLDRSGLVFEISKGILREFEDVSGHAVTESLFLNNDLFSTEAEREQARICLTIFDRFYSRTPGAD
jgi:hypothetical protein